MPTRYIGGDQGTNELTFSSSTNDVYDCTKASAAGAANQAVFHIQIGPPKVDFPFRVIGGPPAVEIFGGKTVGHLDPTRHRAKAGSGIYSEINACCVQVTGNVDAHIHDWTIGATDPWQSATGHCWDGFRINLTNAYNVDHLIERVWVRGIRDDFVENDMPNAETTPGSGGTLTVRDSLAEGVFGGISATNLQNNRTIFLDNIAMLCTNFFEDEVEGAAGHTFGPMFKPDGSGQHGPRWVVSDCVFAYETYDGAAMNLDGQWGGTRIAEAFRRMTCTNTYLCILAAGGIPAGYPARPPGMTVLTGTAARDMWNAKRAELIATITGVPVSGGLVTRNVCSVNQSGLITIDRRLALPTTTMTARRTNSAGFDDEDFAVTVS